ncbi:hypothetical protein DAPPUDRAFT_226110 [Daphnia pulex]|uniref:DUF4772 domain-containing protein n=1 Tax=Daphnia pulex TaxID=6669 RepID=E9GW46_DAPPU|nr:hypothetical protein DAPPUDRAFT_226110 [Daphnia pulex]|eukprot:EFX76328.1 hypothetical protein DAPPUDRAFT_226110 [Daphnia pulex]
MSTGKRLAKRSIVGTKVVVLREDGLYYPGIIQAVKTAEMDPSRGQLFSHTKYAVRSIMETAGHPGHRQQLFEYSEVDLIGPGFQSTAGLTLQPGQKVYITFTGREVAGHVTKHRPDVDEVHITLQVSNSNSVDIVKRMEEVRLMESRKSLRLMDQHDVDFARLAEGVVGGLTASVNGHQDCAQSNPHQISVGNPPRKRCSSASTSGIDVPGAFFGSRKRRSSPSSANGAADVIMDEDEDSDVMDECAAAMVLMRLSCSPHSPRWEDVAAWQQSNHSSSSSSGAFSWRGSVSSSSDSPPHASSSSGSTGAAGRVLPVGTGRKLKFRSATPSPPLMSGSAPANFSGSLNKFHPGANRAPVAKNAQDDGIVSDESISECDEGPSPSQVRTIYQCTWPGCLTTTDNCEAIETHVRSIHLGPRQIDEEISDHEEEFYYTEVEEEGDEEIADQQSTTLPPMAEVVESSVAQTQSFQQPHPGWMASSPPTLSHMDMARPPHEDPEYQRALMKARPIAIPARVRSISWSSGYGYGSNALKQAKVVVSPKTSPSPAPPPAPPSTTGASVFTVKSSPVRRPRGEAKKCRKVYGMEHREQWCTQCKWKKACTRFGE